MTREYIETCDGCHIQYTVTTPDDWTKQQTENAVQKLKDENILVCGRHPRSIGDEPVELPYVRPEPKITYNHEISINRLREITEGQLRALEALSLGLLLEDAARILNIRPDSLRSTLTRARQNLGVESNEDAQKVARERGLLNNDLTESEQAS